MTRNQFSVTRQMFSNAIELRMRARPSADARWAVATNVMLTVPEEGDVIDPFLTLALEDAQQLIDELWHAGLRPSEGSGSAGSLAATKAHLRDMQQIARGLLKKDGVEL